ncbi:MAG: glutamine-hydrolyzing GMP synthase [Acidobacteriota bacterium]
MAQRETVLVLDFGGQYTQLIARRVREHRVYCEIHPFDASVEELKALDPIGIILSGGPQSVTDEDAPLSSEGLFDCGVPILGICYGMQLMVQETGGKVESSSRREYGRTEITLDDSALFASLDTSETVWMSHGDKATQLGPDFVCTASTESTPVVACEDPERKLYGIQFHPEVTHTEHGFELLENFLRGICGAKDSWEMSSYLDEAIDQVRERVGDRRVLCALSGGVDSAVVASLLDKAIGEQLTAVFVDNGVLRKGERDQVEKSLRDGLGLPVVVADARDRFFAALAGVTEPEAKRKAIGKTFIDVFEDESKKLDGVSFLAQGTLYPDVIESVSVRGPSATIKTHHNVGGLPERLGFELIEPLRMLFKDEVRQLGRELGLADEFIGRHPFPGPGLAVRILGEVTPERVATLQEADAIFIEELREGGFYDSVSQALAVLLPVKTVGVMGDGRTYADVVALRSVETQDFMTADWSQLPHEFLGRVASRIVNEVDGVNRVVYDITSKPPGTIEWE